MSMSFTKLIIIIGLSVVSSFLFAQQDFEGLGETSLTLNHKINSKYKINFSVRSRYFMYQDSNFNFENRQLDVVHFSTLNLDYNHSLGLGIQYRFREVIDGGTNELRLTQQFNYTKTNGAMRFGHRLRFEQRILEDVTILRSRYRFALDIPLKGEKLNGGELYLICAMEALLSHSKVNQPELDHRTTSHLGWLLSEALKLQLGLEYRFEAINNSTEQKLFILSGLILRV
ncbi:DUF2490 domain-containing protein [uncultured Winogradskyella sp.]|uniref:DUF2490 domain-containing protein n=1 Tax=uncultured Winogradskyella sp. TaxID=395353 RepID=UPI002615326D|nr:DUF2490 domain-containing protein [uncultured Winogradskyella sp.]